MQRLLLVALLLPAAAISCSPSRADAGDAKAKAGCDVFGKVFYDLHLPSYLDGTSDTPPDPKAAQDLQRSLSDMATAARLQPRWEPLYSAFSTYSAIATVAVETGRDGTPAGLEASASDAATAIGTIIRMCPLAR